MTLLKKLKDNKWLAGILISLSVTAMVLLLYLFKIGEPFELKTIDLRFKLRGPTIKTAAEKAGDKVDIIVISDKTVEIIGKWPFRRAYHGAIVNVFNKYDPAAISFDILFTEEDTKYPEDDSYMVNASSNSDVVNFPFFLYAPDKWSENDHKEFERKVVVNDKLASMTMEYGPELKGKAIRAVAMTPPIAPLIKTLNVSGFVNASPDVDGTTRRVPLVIEYRGRLYFSFAFSVACDYLGVDREDIDIYPGRYLKIKKSDIGPIQIPINEKCELLLNFNGGFDSFDLYSYVNVLISDNNITEGKEPIIDLSRLKDQILFIGLTATGTVDIRATPYSPVYPLVGVLGTLASNVLNKNFLAESSRAVDIIIIIMLGILMGLIAPRLKPIMGAVSSMLMVFVYFGIAHLLFTRGLCLKVIYPSLVIIFGYLAIVVYKFATEEKEKKYIKTVFQRYVSSQVVDEMLSDVDKLNLGGTKMELTIFFADIRGFTSMSEKMTPEEVVGILNRIFTMITEILFNNKGTLDKFMGDCVMAIWGAPIKLDNPDELAIRTALDMQKNMKIIQEELIREGKHPVGFGIGINTGEVVVGNIGSLQRMDYTVIGDEVNLASRIQGCAKSGEVLITDSTYEKVKDIVEVNKLEPVRVKGKTNLIQIYEVLSMK